VININKSIINDKSFEEFYRNIINANNNVVNEVKKIKREVCISIILLISLLLLLVCLSKKTGGGIWLLLLAIPVIVLWGNSKVGRIPPPMIIINIIVLCIIKFFEFLKTLVNKKKSDNKKLKKIIQKNKIIAITEMVNTIYEGLKYYPERGISEWFYKEANFGQYAKFESEDLIIGNADREEKISIAEVTTEELKISKKGEKTKRIPAFAGVFAVVEVGNILGTNIRINTNNKLVHSELIQLNLDELGIEYDVKDFNIYVSDKDNLNTLVLTEIVQKLIVFYDTNKTDFEINIDEKYMYIRFFCGKIFEETSIIVNPFNKKILYKWYSIIKIVFVLREQLLLNLCGKN